MPVPKTEPQPPAGSPEARKQAAQSRAEFWDRWGPENLSEFMQDYAKERANHWRHTVKNVDLELP
jgi:hypothetical protein